MSRNAVVTALAMVVIVHGNTSSQPATDQTNLQRLSRIFSEQLESRRSQLYYDLLASDKLPQKQLNEDPDIQLMFIDKRGYPVYYEVDNMNAARTISTDLVWPGGSGGFSLDGSGTAVGELGIWDGGGVLTTHQEFGGRVTQMDSPGGTSYHSTHVAGTMIATGVDAAAKGMSFSGTLAAYDSNNDESEMASAAAAGMNASNHSYSRATGWRLSSGDWYWYGWTAISQTEDYGFGFYGSTAHDWDEIAYNAPFYTIVKSAGNNRNDDGPGSGGGHYVWNGSAWVWSTDTRDPDGGTDGYDCVPWYGTAKNIITVGAVYDISGGYTAPGDVVMSSFSGWGPTDDGRIKPDIVANGISLYSCDNDHNSDYLTISGTSMSSPNVSGSLNLLVRHYEATHEGVTPLSSTMKALVIQTADEAGPNPGPDYEFGWGLMNTLKAAELIESDVQEPDQIIEASINDGEVYQFPFISQGIDPICITLAWTDPPGTPPPASLNPPTQMLVNDLDLRLEHVATSTVYEPYVLDPSNPSNAAGTGDNSCDNVEQVYVSSPPGGEYLVTVSHKGSLTSTQHFSIVYLNPCAPVISAQNTLGPIPLTVIFNSEVSSEIDSILWDFGDGDTSNVENPSHQYLNPGLYTVTVTGYGTYRVCTHVDENLVSAYADTLRIDTGFVTPGEPVEVAVYATNYIPLKEIEIAFSWAGPFTLVFDSFSTAGLRTDYFEIQSILNYDVFGKRAAIFLNSSTGGAQPHLEPGNTAVATLYFTLSGSPSGTNPIELVSYSSYSPRFGAGAGDYEPVPLNGVVMQAGCCIGTRGNTQVEPNCDDSDQTVDISDLTDMIDHMFISYLPLCCVEEADIAPAIDGLPADEVVDISDLTALIDHLFISYPPLPGCP